MGDGGEEKAAVGFDFVIAGGEIEGGGFREQVEVGLVVSGDFEGLRVGCAAPEGIAVEEIDFDGENGVDGEEAEGLFRFLEVDASGVVGGELEVGGGLGLAELGEGEGDGEGEEHPEPWHFQGVYQLPLLGRVV